MKNTALLIDTNVILNYLTGRSDQYLDSSIKIVKKCASGECTGYIASIRFQHYGMYLENGRTKKEETV